ncbi:MAG: serine/threonine protein kinase [Proteobacteria bacterium]|nr:serine/threonine protein kinase [Pseudomonadota bacterium]
MSGSLAVGITIERYRIEEVIGAGNMGEVFRGVDIDLKRNVALKILAEKHRDNSELRQRFVREARAVAAISHPNVVQVFTTGSYDDRPYIAMEFLDGTDLGTLVAGSGPCSPHLAARAIHDAALGLEAAAGAGLIHRDVKPSNLVLLRSGRVKITDFGLAKPLNPGDEPALTALGVVVGTPDYIAPEQARGDSIDARVDIYALGGTLYYLLAGMPPFRTGRPEDDKYLKVVARHLKKPAPDARTRNPRADIELARLARHMMAKKPAERPDYADIVKKLGTVLARLEKRRRLDLTPRMVQTGSIGGQVSKTPFVGGARPNAFAEDTSGVDLSGATIDRDGMLGDADESAPTKLHLRSRAVDAPDQSGPVGHGQVGAEPRVSRLLAAMTILSALTFITGLGLVLFGPIPEPNVPIPSALSGDTAVPADPAGPDAGSVVPALDKTPEGMTLIRRPDGKPWFYVAIRPVTRGEYRAMFPRQKKPNKRRSDRAVTRVAFTYAEVYARAQGKRLLSDLEWQAASKDRRFITEGDLWEWVTGTEGTADPKDQSRPVRSRRGAATRNVLGGEDITFRLAADVEPAPR